MTVRMTKIWYWRWWYASICTGIAGRAEEEVQDGLGWRVWATLECPVQVQRQGLSSSFFLFFIALSFLYCSFPSLSHFLSFYHAFSSVIALSLLLTLFLLYLPCSLLLLLFLSCYCSLSPDIALSFFYRSFSYFIALSLLCRSFFPFIALSLLCRPFFLSLFLFFFGSFSPLSIFLSFFCSLKSFVATFILFLRSFPLFQSL